MDGYGFSRLISALYEYLSDYGSSVARPALYFIALMMFTFAITLCFDGATYANSDEPYGWQQGLIGSDYEAQLMRSLVLTGQATLNPLGIFATKVLLVAKTGLLAFWLTVHGLISTILIALFIFAVRRKFKIT